MAAKRGALPLLFAIAAIIASSPAFASIPRSSVLEPPAIDRFTSETPSGHREVAPIDVNARLMMAALDRAMPDPVSLSRWTAERLDAPKISRLTGYNVQERIVVFRVKRKLASGVFGLGSENNVWSVSKLSPKTRWGVEFQAHPFAEPMNGKSYVRARWYDPGTGTWLTPDPIGYRDSSNLYAYAGGDPVNGRDPSGTCGDKRKGESWIAYGKRCAQESFNEAKKQAAHLVGGVLGVVVAGGEAVAATARFIQDPPALPSDFVGLSPEETARKKAQNAALKQALLHPFDTFFEKPWAEKSKEILEAEQQGQHMRAGMEAGSYGSDTAFKVLATAEAGAGLVRLGTSAINRATAAATAARSANFQLRQARCCRRT